MDIDRLLNIERRTGIKNDDIDSFLDKATQVQRAIEGMMNGTIDPESVKIDGIETEEEKNKKEVERQERMRIQREKNEELKRKRKIEERERWWSGAEIFKPMKDLSESSSMNSDEDVDPKKKLIDRYNFNYSRWDEWVPNDEASKLEEEEQKKSEEDIKNKEFEKNNPDFCKQFNEDAIKRKENQLKKQESSDVLRLKGNRFFKAKQYEKAHELYMDALKESPYDSKTTLNIAQIYIKNKEYEDALEFISRTLYLDPKNVKALSRKSFVLSETGNNKDAQEVIKKALEIEPDNIDLINLDKEIKVIEKEMREEQMVMNTTKEKQDELSTSTIGTSMNSQKKTLSKIDSLKELIEADYSILLNYNKNPENKGDCFKQKEVVKVFLKDISIAIQASDSSSNNHIVIYVRTSGLLKQLIEYIKCIYEIENNKITFNDVNLLEMMSSIFDLISICVDEQRSSKIIIIEMKLIIMIKSLFPENRSSVSFSNFDEINLFNSYLKLLYNCCRDDICVKTRESILKDKILMNYIGMLSGNISFNMNGLLPSNNNNEIIEKLISSIKYCTLIIKEFAFSDFCKNEATSNTSSVLKGLVCSAAINVNTLLSFTESTFKSTVIEVINCSLEGLLGLSQFDFFRDFFAISIPSDANDKLTPIGILMKSLQNNHLKSDLIFLSNCLACFMNATLESSGSVKNEIYQQGGLKLVEESLNSSEKERKGTDSLLGNIYCRKAGLLSRLTSINEVNKFLLEKKNFRVICRRISSFYKSSMDEKNSIEKWEIDERSHYIRILASLVSTDLETKENMRSIGQEENIIPALLDIFPMPRQDCGVITPQTVTLMPMKPISTLLLGNAARCLLIYADCPNGSKIIYDIKNKSDSLFGIEKFICAMATCTDMRVRKNIAILLAKGCRISGVREKITEFRGMQMMVELQDKL